MLISKRLKLFFKINVVIFDQVYSNTRVLTQVNTSQQESTQVWQELTRVNMSRTQVNTNQHKSKSVLDGLTWANTSPTRV